MAEKIEEINSELNYMARSKVRENEEDFSSMKLRGREKDWEK